MSLFTLPGTLAELPNLHAARGETALRLLASETPVIGFLGPDAPVEIAASVDAHPLRLDTLPRLRTLEPTHQSRAKKLLGNAVDAHTKDLMSAILSGHLARLSGIMISSTHQSHLWLFQLLRELRREETQIPPVHLVDLHHLPRPSTTRYNTAGIHRACVLARRWVPVGRAVETQAAQDAMTLRRQWRAVADLRLRNHLSGSEAQQIVQLADVVGPSATSKMLRALLPILHAREPLPFKRVWLAGSRIQDHRLLVKLEALGFTAVGEDHRENLENNIYGVLSNTPATEGDCADLARTYGHRRPLAHGASPQERAQTLLRDVTEAKVDRVLLVQRTGDEAPAWDRAHCAQALRTHGVRCAQWNLEDGADAVESHSLPQSLDDLESERGSSHD